MAYKVQRPVLVIVLMASVVTMISSQAYLDSMPITFSMTGTTTYLPSSGGISISGYKLSVGYGKYSWLGIKFMTLTSASNYDVLILKRAEKPIDGSYTTNWLDLFAPSGRPSQLSSDSINNMDLQVTSSSESNSYSLNMIRTLGDTHGEDWEGGSFVQVCFFTSNTTFDLNEWKAQYEQCYGYSITSYVSKFIGKLIQKQTSISSTKCSLYGGITGPQLFLTLFWVAQSSLPSQVYLKMGDRISKNLGYDFYGCGAQTGDFYGNSSQLLKSDIQMSGYTDGTCLLSQKSLYFSRDVSTTDSYDQTFKNGMQICAITDKETCESVKVELMFPVMTVKSALNLWQSALAYKGILLLLSLCLLLE